MPHEPFNLKQQQQALSWSLAGSAGAVTLMCVHKVEKSHPPVGKYAQTRAHTEAEQRATEPLQLLTH